MNPSDTCEACRYFDALYADEVRGSCRRYPPTVMLQGEGVVSMYPVVIREDACGEYVPTEVH